MSIDGFLNVAKPSGLTSFRVVAQLRRWSGERRVGHAGTLDPQATGVLPLCLGQATRLVQYLAQAPKSYQARIQLGAATDTYDASGQATYTGDPSSVTRGQVEQALDAFRGTIEQLPPMYSAVRHRGRRLYQFARAGVQVPRRPRRVEIFRLELESWDPPALTLGVECGRGTYLRALAHDLGQALGCGAYLGGLVRTSYGPFHLEDAAPLSQLEEAFRRGAWRSFLHPMDAVLQHLEAAVVGEREELALGRGQPVAVPGVVVGAGQLLRAYGSDGRLIALLRFDPQGGLGWPKAVFLRGPS